MGNIIKTNVVKNLAAGTLLGGAALFTAGLGPANAQPVDAPDGLVSLSVGDVTILESVNADTAAKAAGAICGNATPDVTSLIQRVGTEGAQQTVCDGLPGGALSVKAAAPAPESAQPAETVPATPNSAESVEAPKAPADADAGGPASAGTE